MKASPKQAGIFVTGTDTDIGKTFVCRLLAQCIAKSFPVTYFKPVQTGCSAQGEPLDFAAVRADGAIRIFELSDHVPYAFYDPCSPHLAAQRAGVTVSLPVIEERFQRLASKGAFVIVEGAGGIMVPLNEKEYILDLMVRLALPALLVTSPRLGTLNHTLLSVRALHEAGVVLAGVVINNRANMPHNFIYESNIATLRNRLAPLPVVVVSYGEMTPSEAIEELYRGLV